MSRITVFGTCQVATRSTAGCERSVALMSTSTFGIVYDASPRRVVWNGSTSRQLRRSLMVVWVVASITASVAQVFTVDRPVEVPTWKFSPWRRRAFSVKSTPCHQLVRSGPKSVSNVT